MWCGKQNSAEFEASHRFFFLLCFIYIHIFLFSFLFYFCFSLSIVFNDILHMSFLAGTHVFKAYPAYTTTKI